MKMRVSADQWYQTLKMEDSITLISEPWIEEFYRCNIWHVLGSERDMLVDSGMGVVSLREYVPLVTEKRCLAVTSHTHFDHIGAHHEFEDRLVHHAEADLLKNPTRQSTLVDPYVTDDIFSKLPPVPYQSHEYCVKKAPATRLLEDGDVVDLGDRQFTVIHTPGHSPGGIAIFEQATGVLFSGDIVYDGPLIEDTYHSNAEHYSQSMVKLLDLPVRVVHGGHFPSYGRDRHREIIGQWLESKC